MVKIQDSKEKLTIKWQRLLSNGKTCERCRSTKSEVEKAVENLQQTFPKLGIKVELEKEKVTEGEFKENPKASNRIFIDDEPLEELIGASVGESKCCDVCGEEECRTVIIDGKEHEVVPSHTIINAAMEASEDKLTSSSCCTPTREEDTCCS